MLEDLHVIHFMKQVIRYTFIHYTLYIIHIIYFRKQVTHMRIACDHMTNDINLRMAQGTRCLHAIRNYMRMVTLKYQRVIGIINKLQQPI